MNGEKVFMSVVSLIFVIGWGVLFWSIKNMRNDIKELFNTTNEQAIEINICKHKLWSDDKLIKVINNAIDSKFNAWENRLLRKGIIPSNASKG